MSETTPLVEVVSVTVDGLVPLGIVSTEQALALPGDLEVLISSPEPGGEVQQYVDPETFKKLAEGSGV